MIATCIMLLGLGYEPHLSLCAEPRCIAAYVEASKAKSYDLD